jgi:nucleoside-diphosphate-sugar epimerase
MLPHLELTDSPRPGGRVLVTGGTGYLGSLACAQLLVDGWADHVVVPTRKATAQGQLPADLEREITALGAQPGDYLGRVSTVVWSGAEAETQASLEKLMREHYVHTLVHCAGCLDYFDDAALQALNVDFTARLVAAARDAGLNFVAFVSTAYAAGYSDAAVPEGPLAEPASDPTRYTLTKRHAEHVVARSGLPYVVLRPSIVVGDSRDGRYSGKRYGLYQQWMGIERLLTDRHHHELHTVATDLPVNLLHQDAFQKGLAACLRWAPSGAHVNLVADSSKSPSMKTLWRMFCDVIRPGAVVFYERLEQVDLKVLNVRQRAYLSFAQTNLQIAAYGWSFERGWLTKLRLRGLDIPETSVASIQICQDRFIASSETLARYFSKFGAQRPAEVNYRQAGEPVINSEAA